MTAQHRFTEGGTEKVEEIGGRIHHWHSLPGYTDTSDLLVVKVVIEPGGSHGFHYHPNKEEVIYFISGTAEQWISGESRKMGPGSSVYIPPDAVHATYNRSDEPIEFIAIITPLSAEGPVTVEMDEVVPL